jgi:hypothetical protein
MALRALSIALIVLIGVLVLMLLSYWAWAWYSGRTTAATTATTLQIGTDGVSIASALGSAALKVATSGVMNAPMATLSTAAATKAVADAVTAPVAAAAAAVNAVAAPIVAAATAVTPSVSVEAKAGGAGWNAQHFPIPQHYRQPHVLPYRWF